MIKHCSISTGCQKIVFESDILWDCWFGLQNVKNDCVMYSHNEVNFVCCHTCTSIPWLSSLFRKGSMINLNHVDVAELTSLYLTSEKLEL